ncbi:MAG: hypothetical protein Q9169_008314 [Polycauliona sp. 2 TL-2023]
MVTMPKNWGTLPERSKTLSYPWDRTGLLRPALHIRGQVQQIVAELAPGQSEVGGFGSSVGGGPQDKATDLFMSTGVPMKVFRGVPVLPKLAGDRLKKTLHRSPSLDLKGSQFKSKSATIPRVANIPSEFSVSSTASSGSESKSRRSITTNSKTPGYTPNTP